MQKRHLRNKVGVPMTLGLGAPSIRNKLAKMCYLYRRTRRSRALNGGVDAPCTWRPETDVDDTLSLVYTPIYCCVLYRGHPFARGIIFSLVTYLLRGKAVNELQLDHPRRSDPNQLHIAVGTPIQEHPEGQAQATARNRVRSSRISPYGAQ